MALIKCPECGKEISDTATFCPNCGKKTDYQINLEAKKEKKTDWRIIGFVIFIIGVLMSLAASRM